MKKGDKVILRSFFGTKTSNEAVEDQYNYWKLIGSLGTIKEIREKHSFYPEKGEQALVQFDNLDNLQLVAHNKAPNSLWCFVTDLSLQH